MFKFHHLFFLVLAVFMLFSLRFLFVQEPYQPPITDLISVTSLSVPEATQPPVLEPTDPFQPDPKTRIPISDTQPKKDATRPVMIKKQEPNKPLRKTKPSQLAVLGMHHSATSVLSRILIMMGFWGGEIDDFLIKASDPRKFWERRDVVQAEQWLINQVVPAKDHEGPRWTGYGYDSSRITELHATKFGIEVKKIIDKLNEHRPWFTKDPRMCLMFDRWKEHLDAPACLVVYRHPVVLAKRSMVRFEGLRLNQWIQLWENYTLAALESCRDVPTTLISQSQLEDDAFLTLKSFYYELGRLGFDISNSSLPNLPPLSKAPLSKFLTENETSLTKYLYLPTGSLPRLRLPPNEEISGFLFPPDTEKFPPRPPISEKELRLLTNRQFEMYQNFENYFQKYPTLNVSPYDLAATLLPERPRQKEAYAVLVTSSDSSYAVGAAVIGEALFRIDQNRDRIALVLSSLPQNIRSLLEFSHFKVQEIEQIPEYYMKFNPVCRENQAEMDASRRQRWGKMFNKLRIWELDQYDRVLYLDCDALPHDSIASLFNIRDVPLIAEPGSAHSGFNAGFLLIEPSKRIFDEMMRTLELQKTNKSFPVVFNNIVDCTEQAFLNDFFPYYYPVKISRPHNTTAKGPTPLAHWITTKCPKPWSAKCAVVKSCNPSIYTNWWRNFENLDRRIANLATSPTLTALDRTIVQVWEASKKDGTVAASVCASDKKPAPPKPGPNFSSPPAPESKLETESDLEPESEPDTEPESQEDPDEEPDDMMNR